MLILFLQPIHDDPTGREDNAAHVTYLYSAGQLDLSLTSGRDWNIYH